MPPSIETPQTIKTLSLPVEPVTSNPSSAVTVVEIRDLTAVGEIVEVIELDAVPLESRPLPLTKRLFQKLVRHETCRNTTIFC